MSQCLCVLQCCFGHFCLECLADAIGNVCLAINCSLADVISIYHFVVDVIPPGQMLKPVMLSGMDVVTTCFISCLIEFTWWADVIAIDFCVTGLVVTYWCMMLLFGKCCAKWCLTTLQLLHRAVKLPMADVIAIDSCVRLMLLPYWDNVVWLMFCQVADVIATWLQIMFGWCCC